MRIANKTKPVIHDDRQEKTDLIIEVKFMLRNVPASQAERTLDEFREHLQYARSNTGYKHGEDLVPEVGTDYGATDALITDVRIVPHTPKIDR